MKGGYLLKKSPFFHFLHNFLLNDEFDIRHKLQNVLLSISLIGTALSMVASFAMGFGLAGNLVSLFTTIMLFVTFYISVIRKKKAVASYLICIVVNIILFPLMFVFNGGVYSAMPIWLAFGLIFPWLIIDGVGCYTLFVLDLCAAVGCICLQIFRPDIIIMPPGEDLTLMICLDMIQAMIIVPSIVGLTVSYMGHAFEKQQRKMKIQEKKLKEAMRLAERSNEAMSSFIISLSHEIRTPINAVLGMDEMILRESSDESIISYASNIQSAGESLLSIINDVLDFSKIEAGKLELLPVEYDLQQLLNDCYNMIIMRAEKKNLLLEFHNDPKLPSKLFGDETRIRQIITNLLTNAVKYTSAGNVDMLVSSRRTGEDEIMLRFSVRDTGMGISAENQRQLFKAFSRLDEINNRNIEGTGLGLSITKRLTEMMNGTIGVQSTLGKGSEFWVEIPQRVISEVPVGIFIQNRRRSSGQRKKEYRERFQAPDARILVVDDVKLNIDVIRGLLKATRIKIDSAYSGKECLGLVRKKSYDLIFMDHLMPEMDGVETLNVMRRFPDSPNKDTPVIALTANALVGAKEKYTAMGFTDYLSKPVQTDRLELMLLRYLPEALVVRSDEQTQPEKSASAVMPGSLPKLDTELGIKYCCGSEELYRRLLGMLDLGTVTESLQVSFAASDWKYYEQLCCSLKSTLMTVGAVRTSEFASRLEQQAACGGISFIRKNHNGFIDACDDLRQIILSYLNSDLSEGEKY